MKKAAVILLFLLVFNSIGLHSLDDDTEKLNLKKTTVAFAAGQGVQPQSVVMDSVDDPFSITNFFVLSLGLCILVLLRSRTDQAII